MGPGLTIFVLVAQTALWIWLVVVVRPRIKAKLERWLWHRLGGKGDPPA